MRLWLRKIFKMYDLLREFKTKYLEKAKGAAIAEWLTLRTAIGMARVEILVRTNIQKLNLNKKLI